MFGVSNPNFSSLELTSYTSKELWSLNEDKILTIWVKKRRSLNFHFKDEELTVVLEKDKLRACLHRGGGPQVGEVTRLSVVTRLSI